MQLFSIFYTLKNSVSLLFNKFSSQSLNPSRNVLKCFIVFTPYIYLIDFCISFSISFFPACSIYLLPGSWEFCCLVAVTFKFTVLYKSVNSNKQDKSNTTTKFCILKYQISLWRNNFEFWDQIFSKRVFPFKSKKKGTSPLISVFLN